VALELAQLDAGRGHFKRWRIAPLHEQAQALAAELRLPGLVGQLLCQRGVEDSDSARSYLDPKLTDLHDPNLLPGCDEAARRLVDAVRAGEQIVIYGDYDVDGITATAILYHAIKAADPNADVRRYVPHRIDEGYGLNSEAIAGLCGGGARVIVSVDCGITAVEPATVAYNAGVDLIITDHHQPAANRPQAFAIVHPGLKGGTYPFPELCGAGVAYKLAWQFARCWCGSEQVSDALRKVLIDLLPLAALGTIADVVPLIGENRIIASFGLRRIRHTPLVGLNALLDASRLRDEKVDSYHVGFILGPKLNACGRMGHARQAVRLLTDADPAESQRIAEFLNGENDRRRATERKIFEQAKAMVLEQGFDAEDCRAIVLAHREWHAGVVGIVCSRLVEAFGRPAVLLSTANGEAHGSARSIHGFDLHAAFTACAGHLLSFGGHAMAAGLRLSPQRIDDFRSALTAHARQHISVEQLTAMLEIDAQVDLADLTPAAVGHIEQLQPFGRGNDEPLVLVRGLTLKQPASPLGREARHLAMIGWQNGTALRCVGWNLGHLLPRLPAGAEVDIVAEPKLNRFNGRTTVELVIHDLRWAG
jgi:single-stranded-DNA-specific exonuclease